MKKFLFCVCFILFSFVLSAQHYQAKVIGVKDGDTVEILYNGLARVVRLAHIDAPEKNQPYGKKAKQYLSSQCFGQVVEVVVSGRPDRYGRWIAEIFYRNQNLNKAMVRKGMAWHFKKYSSDSGYAELESAAKAKRVGLWRQENPVAPWDWRKQRRELRK
ncbi:thermonuclease family protein [Bergeyella sp. RCAD1439]|uniref:thermonuclease family protein n=1 Tax=Bergeyella anatis TaxID=3113737 RepID=UPI002E1767CB|nr:thermonuclease family protein [Bergeyella sp. RCAD1439]